jgi:hypothetical protein
LTPGDRIRRKAHLSSKKLLEQCQKLEKLWSHVFTATLNLNNMTAESQWYTKLTDLIDKQQTAPIWMSESKVHPFLVVLISRTDVSFIRNVFGKVPKMFQNHSILSLT